jgi:hypothetical protein
VLDVERWAELRREHFVRGVSIRESARNTVRAALRSSVPPGFCCPERPSKLDPFKDEVHRLLKVDPRLFGGGLRARGGPAVRGDGCPVRRVGDQQGVAAIERERARKAREAAKRGRDNARRWR